MFSNNENRGELLATAPAGANAIGAGPRMRAHSRRPSFHPRSQNRRRRWATCFKVYLIASFVSASRPRLIPRIDFDEDVRLVPSDVPSKWGVIAFASLQASLGPMFNINYCAVPANEVSVADVLGEWKTALHSAILPTTWRLFHATPPPKSLTRVQGQGGGAT